MKLLVDMNLSPDWGPFLTAEGVESIHWSSIGKATAPDTEIMGYASAKGYTVLTQDLDFGAILAATQASRPSVVQIRSDDLDPNAIGRLIVAGIIEGRAEIESGALVTVDPKRYRLRLLPFPTE